MPLIRSSSLPNLSSRAPLSSKEVKKTLSLFNLTSIQNASEDLHRNLTPKLKTNLDQASNVVRFLNGASACAMLPTSTTSEQNCFAVYINVLQKSNLQKNEIKGAVRGIKLFMKAQSHWDEIHQKLNDPIPTPAEKKRYFNKMTTMFVHHKTDIDFILNQLPIIFQQSLINMDSWKNNPKILNARFNSDTPCFEGRNSTFFASCFEKVKGKIDIEKSKIDNLLSYLNKYCFELELGDNPAEFRRWFIGEGGSNGETSEGKITLNDLNKFIIYADKELVMLRKEETEK